MGGGLVYRGSLLAGAQRETAEGGRLNFHLDHLGSPRLTTNAAGQKVTANEFAPFGRELASITQEAQLGYDHTATHRFTGHERDFVEGTTYDTVNFIDYMHARTYTPVFRRFLSVDPGSYSTFKPQSWNRYAYVRNNSINTTDPTGQCEQQPGKPPCSDMTIMVEAKAPSVAVEVMGDALDITAFDFFKMSGSGNIFAGLLKGDAGQIGKGYGQQVLLAAPGGVASGLRPLVASGDVVFSGTTTLFRSVSQAEYEQVLAEGAFKAGPGSLEGNGLRRH